MKASTLLRKAAQVLENRMWGFGCHLIEFDVKEASAENKELALYFLMKFEPTFQEQKDFTYTIKNSGFWGTGEANQNDRIVGLCMAAALAESYGV